MKLRASITIKNNTKYFDPDRNPVQVTVGNPNLFTSRQRKMEAYEVRLYYEYLDVQRVGGQTFYYTLTYNEKSVPKYYGHNVFDYEDLRYLLNGGFKKMLLRKYGSDLKYFVGAELGEGEGVRGMANNPHYHILFFLRPTKNPRYPYVKIDPQSFCDLVQTYWQGFRDSAGFHDYRTAKFGIAKAGKNLGLVNSVAACIYCAKYVTKDVRLKSLENEIRYREFRPKMESLKTDHEVKFDFVEQQLLLGTITLSDILEYDREYFVKTGKHVDPLLTLGLVRSRDLDVVSAFVNRFMSEEYHIYCVPLAEAYVNDLIRIFRNRHSNKCRISQGVGISALDTIDPMNPTLTIITKSGVKTRPMSLYYFRKLYYDVKKCPMTGNNLYRLNSKGVEYKLSQLTLNIRTGVQKLQTLGQVVALNEDFYKCFADEYSLALTRDEFLDYAEELGLYDDSILFRYMLYKLVYKGRLFNLADAKQIRPQTDFVDFMTDSFDYTDYTDDAVALFLKTNDDKYIPYLSHPFFSPFKSSFTLLECLEDYNAVITSEKVEKDYEERKRAKHSILNVLFKDIIL